MRAAPSERPIDPATEVVPPVRGRRAPGAPRTRALVALCAVLAVAAGACSSDEGSAGNGGSDGAADAGGAIGDAPAEGDDAPALQRLDVDLTDPIAAVAAPGGGALLVAERAGPVVEVTLDGEGGATGVEPVIDITDRVGSLDSEKGLLGLAVDPDGSTLYLSYTRAADGASQVDAYDMDASAGTVRVDPGSRRSLLEVDQPFANHNGGHLAFGPDDLLYLSLGDGGGGGDPEGRAQDRGELLGKILRLDPHSPDGIPSDNPFADGADGARPEIWLTGVRNPWRFSFDRDTGDLWIADVGQDRIEEVDLLPAAEGGGRGANLGWDLFEGDEEFDDPDPSPGDASAGPFVDPVFTYSHDLGCSISGGVVYRGDELPSLQGAYLFSDFCTPGIQALRMEDGAAQVTALGIGPSSVVGFAEDDLGEVYVISLSEGLFRLRAG